MHTHYVNMIYILHSKKQSKSGIPVLFSRSPSTNLKPESEMPFVCGGKKSNRETDVSLIIFVLGQPLLLRHVTILQGHGYKCTAGQLCLNYHCNFHWGTRRGGLETVDFTQRHSCNITFLDECIWQDSPHLHAYRRFLLQIKAIASFSVLAHQLRI